MSRELSEEKILRLAAAIRGRRGGKKTSQAKTDATKKSLEKARAARWPKTKPRKA